MIISRSHRYVFVELPRTGSSAARRELRKLYDGSPILDKHSNAVGPPPDVTGLRTGARWGRRVDERMMGYMSTSGVEPSCWIFGRARVCWQRDRHRG